MVDLFESYDDARTGERQSPLVVLRAPPSLASLASHFQPAERFLRLQASFIPPFFPYLNKRRDHSYRPVDFLMTTNRKQQIYFMLANINT